MKVVVFPKLIPRELVPAIRKMTYPSCRRKCQKKSMGEIE